MLPCPADYLESRRCLLKHRRTHDKEEEAEQCGKTRPYLKPERCCERKQIPGIASPGRSYLATMNSRAAPLLQSLPIEEDDVRLRWFILLSAGSVCRILHDEAGELQE